MQKLKKATNVLSYLDIIFCFLFFILLFVWRSNVEDFEVYSLLSTAIAAIIFITAFFVVSTICNIRLKRFPKEINVILAHIVNVVWIGFAIYGVITFDMFM